MRCSVLNHVVQLRPVSLIHTSITNEYKTYSTCDMIHFMKKQDARKLDHKTREIIRIRAVKQVEAGESPEAVIKALGYHRSAIYQWIAKYREGGIEALKTKKISGRPSKLQGKDLQKLYRMIVDKDPLQYKFSFALWTRDMIRELIKKELLNNPDFIKQLAKNISRRKTKS